jgi:hypothetical protein
VTAPDWVPWVLSAVLGIATLVLALHAKSQSEKPDGSQTGASEEFPDLREGGQRP